jgi:hypothetical protein
MIRLLLVILLFPLTLYAQSSIRVMQYNLLYYGTYPSFCPVPVNDVEAKDDYLKTIFEHVMPDVFCVNELGSGDVNASRILNNVLNTNGRSYYRRALSANNGTSTIVNMLYFDSRKLRLHSQEQVQRDLNNTNLVRIIDLYKLFLNDPNLEQTRDTTFITFIVAHLKAGSSSSDAAQRARATAALMDLIASKGEQENYIFSGDFNLYTSSETAYQNMINYPDPSFRFYDPIEEPGAWSNNTDYLNIHTQSTRTTANSNNGCFASGGSDDRFDFIMISESVKNNALKVKYKPDSYTVIGQDGNRYKQPVNDPANFSAPADVINALFEMSDHYPLALDLELDISLNMKNFVKNENIKFVNPVKDILDLQIECDCNQPLLEIISLTGSVIYKKQINDIGNKFYHKADLSSLPHGIYHLKITNSNGESFGKKFIKIEN